MIKVIFSSAIVAAIFTANSVYAQSINRQNAHPFIQSMLKSKAVQITKDYRAKPTVDANCYVYASSMNYYDNMQWHEDDSLRYYWHVTHGLGVDVFNQHNDFFEFRDINENAAVYTYLMNLPSIYWNFDMPILDFKPPAMLDSLEFYYDDQIDGRYLFHNNNGQVTSIKDGGVDFVDYRYTTSGLLELQTVQWGNYKETDSAVYNASDKLTDFYRFNSDDSTVESNHYVYNANEKIVVRSFLRNEGTIMINHEIDSLFELSTTQDSVVSYYWDMNTGLYEVFQTAVYTSNNNYVNEMILQYADDPEIFTFSLERNSSGNLVNGYGYDGTDTIAHIVAEYDNDVLQQVYIGSKEMTQWEYYANESYSYDSLNNLTSVKTYAYKDPITNTWINDDYDFELKLYYKIDGTDTDTTHIKQLNTIDFAVYPNPTVDKLTVLCNDNMVNSIAIYNQSGRLVKFVNNIYKHEYEIDVKELAIGNYSIHINNGVGIRKFIKQ